MAQPVYFLYYKSTSAVFTEDPPQRIARIVGSACGKMLANRNMKRLTHLIRIILQIKKQTEDHSEKTWRQTGWPVGTG